MKPPESEALRELKANLRGENPHHPRVLPPGVSIAPIEDRDAIDSANPGKPVMYFDRDGWVTERANAEHTAQQHRTLFIAIAWAVGITLLLLAFSK
jgi:hypothetical protein